MVTLFPLPYKYVLKYRTREKVGGDFILVFNTKCTRECRPPFARAVLRIGLWQGDLADEEIVCSEDCYGQLPCKSFGREPLHELITYVQVQYLSTRALAQSTTPCPAQPS
jgi:hypothetical protein